MSQFSVFLPTFRLRTLPLAIACICVGTAMGINSISVYAWQPWVFLLTLLTACALQILSNIANDYGDGVKGTDARQVCAQPKSMAPRITANSLLKDNVETIQMMRQLLVLWSVATFLIGLGLICYATQTWTDFLIFLVLGIFSLFAAITYTVGRKAYGYYGLGDMSVFVFFGLVGVLGSCYLQARQLPVKAFAPAVSIGALCVAVLNINNLRDFDTDLKSGKHTFAQFLGRKNAKRYHLLLVTVGLFGFALTASWLNVVWCGNVWLVTVPLFILNCQHVWQASNADLFNKALFECVKLTCLCSLLFSINIVINSLIK